MTSGDIFRRNRKVCYWDELDAQWNQDIGSPQLRLQQSVEGLSVAAFTDHLVGLVGYLANAAHVSGVPIDADLATGLAVPVVALAVWTGLWRFRRRIEREEHQESN